MRRPPSADRSTVSRLAVLGCVLFASAAAFAWTSKATFGTSIHKHRFHDVFVENADCTLQFRLLFTAPPEAYPKPPRKTHYHFRAHLKFASGRVFTTNVFWNDAAGERVYARAADTSGDGCWAKTAETLVGVEVDGCRGKNCTPESPLP